MGTTKIYSRNLSNFRGVDLTSNASLVAPTRFAYLQNMYRDYNNDMGAMAETIAGFRERYHAPNGGRINGIHKFLYKDKDGVESLKVVVHAGNKLYEWLYFPETTNIKYKASCILEAGEVEVIGSATLYTYTLPYFPNIQKVYRLDKDDEGNTIETTLSFAATGVGWCDVGNVLTIRSTVFKEGDTINIEYYEHYDDDAYGVGTLEDHESMAFVFYNKLYILDGTGYYCYDGTTLTNLNSHAYIPTTLIGAKEYGTVQAGTTFESKNMLTPYFKNTFYGVNEVLYTEAENGAYYFDETDGTYKECVDGTTYEHTYNKAPLVCTLSDKDIVVANDTLSVGLEAKQIRLPTLLTSQACTATPLTEPIPLMISSNADGSTTKIMVAKLMVVGKTEGSAVTDDMRNSTIVYLEYMANDIYGRNVVYKRTRLYSSIAIPVTIVDRCVNTVDSFDDTWLQTTAAGWTSTATFNLYAGTTEKFFIITYRSDILSDVICIGQENLIVKVNGVKQSEYVSTETYSGDTNYPYIADAAQGTITFPVGHIPPFADEPNIEITAKKVYKTIQGVAAKLSSTYELIAGCTIGTTFDDRIFLTGNPKCPNHIFWCGINSTGYVDATYWGILNYQQDGVGDAGIVGLLSVGDTLMALKGDTNQDSSVYFHSKAINTGNNEIPVSYPSTQGMAGVGCLGGCLNFRDDPIFISRQGVEAVGKLSVKLERAIEHRSAMVDSFLTNRDLSKAMVTAWNGYLIVAIDGEFFVADSRQMFTHTDGTPQYEWYYWKDINIFANQTIEDDIAVGGTQLANTYLTTMLDSDIENIFVGTENGTIFSFNFDKRNEKGEIPTEYYTFNGRNYTSGCATVMDDCGMPLEAKTTIKKSLIVRTRTFTRSKLHIKVRTNLTSFKEIADINSGRFDFNDINFEDLSFETNDNSIIAVKDNTKKWAEKQYYIYSDEFKAPFALYGIGYKFRIAGRIK